MLNWLKQKIIKHSLGKVRDGERAVLIIPDATSEDIRRFQEALKDSKFKNTIFMTGNVQFKKLKKKI